MGKIHGLIPAMLFAVLAGPAGSAAGEVYKWMDEAGQVHYGDRVPAGGRALKAGSGAAPAQVTPYASGLRKGERRALRQAAHREHEVLQSRRDYVSRQAAVKSGCSAATERYDRAKRRPGAAKSPEVSARFEEMRTRCR